MAPLLTGLGGLLLLSGVSFVWGGRLLLVGSVGLVVLFGLIVRRHAAVYTVTMAAGAVAWLVGNALWVGGRPMAYLPVFYGPLIVLHLSLLVRTAGDLFNVVPLRQWGGLLNGVALLLFLGLTALGLARGAPARTR